MKKLVISCLLCFLPIARSVAGGYNGFIAADGPPDQTDQLIIKYRDARQSVSSTELQQMSTRHAANLKFHRAMSGGAVVVKLDKFRTRTDARILAQQIATDPNIEYAEPDYRLYPMGASTDPYYGSQWGLNDPVAGINASSAWDITTGNPGQVVAVIDTGIRPHAEFSGRIVQGYDFITNSAVANDGSGRDNDASDPGDWVTSAESASGTFQGCAVTNSSWHGTHVSGIIAANGANGIGVAGVNWKTKILPVRVLGKCGGYNSDIADGIRWAAGLSVTGAPANSNPAKVLNMSLGGGGSCSATFQGAINDAIAAGATVVVAAGNSAADAANFQPASCSGVISVAAIDQSGAKASYSNYGSIVKISAPGSSIISTLNTGTTVPASDTYAYYSGTSMAAPHVTGVVSLMLAVNPSLTPAQVQQKLQATARAFPSGSSCNTGICGAGIVNAYAAVNSVKPTVPVSKWLPVVLNQILD